MGFLAGVVAAVGRFFHERVWLSKKSTILGLLVFMAGELLNYLGQLPNLPASAHLILSLIAAPFLLWRDQAVKDGTIKLTALFLFLSLGAHAARPVNGEALADAVASDPAAVQPAEDPPPTASQFGGCVNNGKLCFGPSVVVTLAAINLKTKTIEGAFSPGVGYGLTVNPGKWSSFGADWYFTMDPAAQKASVAVLLKFFNGYFRVGASKGFLGDVAWRVPLAFGVSL